MKASAFAKRCLALALLLPACTSVAVEQAHTTSGSGGAGGTGGECHVSVPAGCACPDAAGPWSSGFGEPGGQKSTRLSGVGALPIAPDGSTVVRLTISDGPDDHVTDSRYVKIDGAGKSIWERTDLHIHAPVPDPRDCSVVGVGTQVSEDPDLLGQTGTCQGLECLFIARLDAGGNVVSVKTFEHGPEIEYTFQDAWLPGVLPDGRMAMVGSFNHPIDLGLGPFGPAKDSFFATFVAQLGPDGDVQWARYFEQIPQDQYLAGPLRPSGTALSPTGDVALTQTVAGGVDFGDGVVPAPTPLDTVVLVAYDSTGALRFSRMFGTTDGTPQSSLELSSLAYAPSGDLVAVGHLQGTVDFGSGPIGDPAINQAVIAAFDGMGQHRWSKSLGQQDWAGGVLAIDPAGHVWLSIADGSVLELDAAGAMVAMHPIGGTGKRSATAIGFAPGGAPVLAGFFDGSLDIGSGSPLAAQGSTDAFVTRLAP